MQRGVKVVGGVVVKAGGKPLGSAGAGACAAARLGVGAGLGCAGVSFVALGGRIGGRPGLRCWAAVVGGVVALLTDPLFNVKVGARVVADIECPLGLAVRPAQAQAIAIDVGDGLGSKGIAACAALALRVK
jgi:hypothetical protein